jgi:hypothetical protein
VGPVVQATRLEKRILETVRARRGATVVLLTGLMLVLSSILGLGARAGTGGGFSTNLAAEPGQNPMPTGVTSVPEDCKGIAPTNGSHRPVTQKQLNEGQGIIKPSGASSSLAGGTVHWLIKYNPSKKAKAKSFDIRDCVVEFLPGNTHLAGVLAMVDTSPTGYGQIIVTGPGATPDSKGYDNVLDNAEFDFPNVDMPGEFDLSWVIPPDAPPGALICNYAKDTGGETKGGNENRKAGACFTVKPPPTTTTTTVPQTTTTTVPQTTTTTVPQTTTTTEPPTTTTVPETTTTTVATTTTTEPTTTTTVPETTTTVPETTTTTIPCESTTTVPDETTTTNPHCETTTTTVPPTTTTVPVTTTTVPCESTTTTVAGETTTTNPQCTTTTTAPAVTTTTAPVTVLGEQFVKPSGVANDTLARTGSDVRVELLWAGLALILGGLGGLFAERKRGALVED